MSQSKQTAEEFIQSTFSPHVAVLCSPDAELLCQKNNLTFHQLIQPFCRLSSEGEIIDQYQIMNITHTRSMLLFRYINLFKRKLHQFVKLLMLYCFVNNVTGHPSTGPSQLMIFIYILYIYIYHEIFQRIYWYQLALSVLKLVIMNFTVIYSSLLLDAGFLA